MENLQEIHYVKGTQKNYTMPFKLQVVQEVESDELSTHSACRKYEIQSCSTIVQWLRKFGNFDGEDQIHQQNKLKIKTYKTKNTCKNVLASV